MFDFYPVAAGPLCSVLEHFASFFGKLHFPQTLRQNVPVGGNTERKRNVAYADACGKRVVTGYPRNANWGRERSKRLRRW